ncbi:hypothetical protein FIE12Z_966 [Fusarium flagelliforme]|uniref:Uncharacterized protein n=1 Tax=Fusarium flagelliforme TaxID=2675880 RepID=A0A395N3N1_9HYPO|nr:hypothetical protein FIE12Z_966 [Fusarium flagelliforme]
MPTATEFFGYSAHNLGPLTTTFTAPSSCATGTDHIVFVNASDPVHIGGIPTCGTTKFGDCLPSGSARDDVFHQTTEWVQGQYVYYSPGIACPSGWRTVGALKHDGDESSASGALASPTWGDIGGALRPLPPQEFWLGLLDPSETLAFCCPSDYQADAYGHCISTLGPTLSYTYSEMCLVFSSNSMVPISTFDGTTLGRNELISLASATDEPRTTLDDIFLTPTEVAEYWGIGTFVPAIPLIYKEEDVKNATETGTDDEEGDDDPVEIDNSASRGGVVSVLGVTLGLLAGRNIVLKRWSCTDLAFP